MERASLPECVCRTDTKGKTLTLSGDTESADIIAFAFANDSYVILVRHAIGDTTTNEDLFVNSFELP